VVLRETSNAFGWDAQRKKSETYTQRSEMMLRFVRNGLNLGSGLPVGPRWSTKRSEGWKEERCV